MLSDSSQWSNIFLTISTRVFLETIPEMRSRARSRIESSSSSRQSIIMSLGRTGRLDVLGVEGEKEKSPSQSWRRVPTSLHVAV